jgi:quercetin dioxygenase-like cupin family protein
VTGTLEITLDRNAPAAIAYPPPSWHVREPSQARLLSPPGGSLWLYRVTLGAGSRLRWASDHGDEGVYVLSGSLRVAGRDTDRDVVAGGAAIVESGVSTEVVATADCQLLHFGSASPDPPEDGPYGAPKADGHVVHAVGPAGIYAAAGEGRDTRFYADSSCPTCRITLMRTGREGPYVSAPHSHSQDELIHVLSGQITLGRSALRPGDTLYVQAGRRYTFTGGPDGFSFLNYRRDASLHAVVRGGEPRLEGGAAHGFTHIGDVVDVSPREGTSRD